MSGKTEGILIIQDIEKEINERQKRNVQPVYGFTSTQHMTIIRVVRRRLDLIARRKIREQADIEMGLFPERELERESFSNDYMDIQRYKIRTRMRSMSA
jgi:hypothetical protein